jgi:hypothetical protein
LDDPAAEQAEVHELALLDDRLGNTDSAIARFERALELAKRLGDPNAEALESRNIGRILGLTKGEIERGRRMIQDSLALFERLGNVYEIGVATSNLPGAMNERATGRVRQRTSARHYNASSRCSRRWLRRCAKRCGGSG